MQITFYGDGSLYDRTDQFDADSQYGLIAMPVQQDIGKEFEGGTEIFNTLQRSKSFRDLVEEADSQKVKVNKAWGGVYTDYETKTVTIVQDKDKYVFMSGLCIELNNAVRSNKFLELDSKASKLGSKEYEIEKILIEVEGMQNTGQI